MKKSPWPWLMCVGVAILVGFATGGGHMVTDDGQVIARSSFNVMGAVVGFVLAWAAGAIATSGWQLVKDNVIAQHESEAKNASQGQPARQSSVTDRVTTFAPTTPDTTAHPLPTKPPVGNAPPEWYDARQCEFEVGNVVRFGHTGPFFTVTKIDGAGMHLVSQGGRAQVADAVAQSRLILAYERGDDWF